MLEIDGLKVATPAYSYPVGCLDDMEHDTFYPSRCFSSFMLSRGRTLAIALGQDPSAPESLKVKNAKCYTRAQIADYLSGYGDGFAQQAAEVNAKVAALRVQDEADLERRRKEVDEEFAAIFAEKVRMQAAYEAEITAFSKRFIAKYAKDITSETDSVCGVYFLRDGKKIVYIGQSRNVYQRIAGHRKTKQFDGVDFLPCEKARLDELEGFFIRLLRPALNGHDEGRKYGAPKSALWGEVVRLNIPAS